MIDTACMLRSGLTFLISDKTRVESTPPLKAIETVWASRDTRGIFDPIQVESAKLIFRGLGRGK